MNILKISQVEKEDIEIIENISCPFCKEDDFDLIGLKIHLESGWCEKYNSIDVNERFKRF